MEKKVYYFDFWDIFKSEKFPMDKQTYHLLAEDIKENGCRVPLVVWKGQNIIIDGHKRYMICHNSQIPFYYIEVDFKSEIEAARWYIFHHISHRNLTEYSRCELIFPFENILLGNGNNKSLGIEES